MCLDWTIDTGAWQIYSSTWEERQSREGFFVSHGKPTDGSDTVATVPPGHFNQAWHCRDFSLGFFLLRLMFSCVSVSVMFFLWLHDKYRELMVSILICLLCLHLNHFKQKFHYIHEWYWAITVNMGLPSVFTVSWLQSYKHCSVPTGSCAGWHSSCWSPWPRQSSFTGGGKVFSLSALSWVVTAVWNSTSEQKAQRDRLKSINHVKINGNMFEPVLLGLVMTGNGGWRPLIAPVWLCWDLTRETDRWAF